MARSSGVYCICVGPSFYIGSSRRLGARISSHRRDLARGTHPSQKLQQAWNTQREIVALVIHECPINELLQREDALIRDMFEMPGCCNSSETAYFNSKIGDITRARWKIPDQRQKLVAAMQGRTFTEETKQKMAEAKRGNKNAKARRCSLELRGETLEFDTATAAAKHYGASQQAMDLWLRGVVPWPGKGPRKPKKSSAHLIGLSGSYLS